MDAQAGIGALGDDEYAQLIKRGVDQLAQQLAAAPPPVAVFAAPRHIPRGWLVLEANNHEGRLMFAAYLTVTIVASVLTGLAAVTYLIGHDYPKAQADLKRIPRSWVPVLGTLLAAGSLGLLAGFAVPLLGALAAGGLVLYFVGALVAHLRVGSRQLVGGAVFLATAVAAFAVNLSYHFG